MSQFTVAHHKPTPPPNREAGTRIPRLTEHGPPIGTERCAVVNTRTGVGDACEQIVAQRTGGQLTPAVAGAADASVAPHRSEFTELLEALVDIANR